MTTAKWSGVEYFCREIGIQIVKYTPEHPQSNGIVERFNAVLVKIIHAVMTEGRDPRTEVQRCLLNYHNTTHPSTGFSSEELIKGRCTRI